MTSVVRTPGLTLRGGPCSIAAAQHENSMPSEIIPLKAALSQKEIARLHSSLHKSGN
ncbi:hypothetical protein J3R74_000451 [Puniceicoccus vermicola]